jgi:hypothetical protein|tara:strand:+ start:132 stop:623 length:492 start_codon:yes stop_codon:yes gene_type:complete
MALSTIGANQLSAGPILQVISSSSTDVVSTDTATFADIPFATATITPRATSSKILIQYSFGMMGSSGNSVGALMKLLRDSTEVGQGSGADTINVFNHHWYGANGRYSPRSHMFIDSPNSTSALVYKLQWRVVSAGSETWYINRRGLNNYSRSSSTFYVMEIAG